MNDQQTSNFTAWMRARGLAPRTRELYTAALADLDMTQGPELPQRMAEAIAKRRNDGEHTFWATVTYNAAVAYQRSKGATPTIKQQLGPMVRHPRAPRCHSREAMTRLLALTEPAEARMLLTLAYSGALRASEVVALKLNDVTSTPGKMLIRDSKTGKNAQVQINHGLQRAVQRYGEAHNMRGRDQLFPGAPYRIMGGIAPYMSERQARRIWSIAQDSHGLERLTFHSIRHAAAVHMLEQGAHLEQVRRHLRHASLNSTQVYLQCLECPEMTPLSTEFHANFF